MYCWRGQKFYWCCSLYLQESESRKKACHISTKWLILTHLMGTADKPNRKLAETAESLRNIFTFHVKVKTLKALHLNRMKLQKASDVSLECKDEQYPRNRTLIKSGIKELGEEKGSERTTETLNLTFDKAIGQASEIVQTKIKFIRCGNQSKARKIVKKSEMSHANRPSLE